MASTVANNDRAYILTSNLNIWFKLKDGTPMTLADFPELLPFRWDYFRDQWEFIKKDYIAQIDTVENSNLLKKHIESLSQFIEAQRNSKTNPFAKRDALFSFFAIFDATLVTAYPLTQDEQDIINEKQKTISRWTRDDFVLIRAELVKFRDQYSDARGLQDETYNRINNRSSVAKQTDPTNFDMNYIGSINEGIRSIDFILANQFALSTSFIDPFAQARANTNNPDIDIRNYSTGTLVKMNYGQDLRGLARQYLDNEDRWIEIAIANGLKPPYIDEVGERIALLSNGSENKVIVGSTDSAGKLNIDKFYVNQVLFVQSDSITYPDQRVVVNIEQIPISGNIILELDGEPNLSQYQIASGAHLRVFKPNTINSNFFVLIPSGEPTDDTRKDITPWFLQSSSEDIKKLKVDLALDANGDITFDNNADLNLTYGHNNAVQAVKLKMGVQRGELFQHEDFGLTTLLGKTNVKRSELRQVLSDSINALIEADPRFDRIETMEIIYTVDAANMDAPAGFNINLTVKLAGSNSVIPISFRINA